VPGLVREGGNMPNSALRNRLVRVVLAWKALDEQVKTARDIRNDVIVECEASGMTAREISRLTGGSGIGISHVQVTEILTAAAIKRQA
jgi:hypothetical protein